MRKACVLAMIAVAAMAQEPEKFYSAIRENNLTQLKALLRQNEKAQKGSANVADDRGITPLMYAAEIGSLDAMRLLIDGGADVNAQNAFGSTALMWSVSDPAKVRLLLDHGAQVNTVARSGRTALIVAAFTNPSAEVVKLLLAKGAKVGVMDRRHVTPLNAATFGNDTATVRLLLEAGADIETPDTFIGLTPLMNAAGNRNVEAVKLLLAKGAGVNAVSKTEGLPKIQTGTVEFGGWTPLLMAAAFGPPEAVNMLLNAGARIDAQDYRGFTPLDAGGRHGPIRPPHHQNVDRSRSRPSPDESRRRDRARLGLEIRGPGSDPRPRRDPEGRCQADPAAGDLADSSTATRTAITRSLQLLERTNDQFFKKSGCFACHEQPPALFAAAAARAKGIPAYANAEKAEKAFHERLLQITSTINASPA